jgi:uncharacterized membrane protein
VIVKKERHITSSTVLLCSPVKLSSLLTFKRMLIFTPVCHFILSTLSCNLVPLNTACQKNTIMCRLHQCPISYWVHCPVIWYLLIQPVKKYNYVQITSISHFILSTLSCNLVPLNTACQKIQLCADYINVPFHTEYTVL